MEETCRLEQPRRNWIAVDCCGFYILAHVCGQSSVLDHQQVLLGHHTSGVLEGLDKCEKLILLVCVADLSANIFSVDM